MDCGSKGVAVTDQHTDAAKVPPGRHDPAARRQQIIRTTADLIPEYGTAKLTHRLIADRAGVSLGSMTRYFATLDELIDEAVTFIVAELTDELGDARALVAERGCTPEVLTEIMTSFFNDQDELHDTAALYAAGIADPKLRHLVAQWSEGMFEILHEYVPEDTADAIVLVMDGATAHAVVGRQPSAETLRATFAALIGPKAGSSGADTPKLAE